MFSFHKKTKQTEKKSYDREHQKPVLKCSICNGEQVAGFKDTRTGKMEEVMFIRSDKDLEIFMETYDIADRSMIVKEY